MGKRLFLIGGENTHLFPVVSELGTTVETNHVGSRLRGSLATALSWLAGLGKANSFVPASEQSVKDLHKLLLAVASNSLTLQNYLVVRMSDHRPDTFVTVSSGFCPDFVSLDFNIPDDTNCHCFVCNIRFQYVERRYFGFVALSFIVGADAGRDALENQGVKRHKKYIPIRRRREPRRPGR